MSVVNISAARADLSRLVEALQSGAEREIIIARNGRPAAKLVPIHAASRGKRIGVAKGKYVIPHDIDAHDALIGKLFIGRAK